MFRVMIQGRRSFIVGDKDVLKGGKEKIYNVAGQVTKQFELEPGKFIYEVSDECGQFLETFSDIFVIEKPAHLVGPTKADAPTVDSTNALLIKAMEQITELQKQVLALSKPAPKKKRSVAKPKEQKTS